MSEVHVAAMHTRGKYAGRCMQTEDAEGDISRSSQSVCTHGCVYVCLLLGITNTFCAHSHQQMPPDCSRNNQLYTPNLMTRRQIREGLRIPGLGECLPLWVKEKLPMGREYNPLPLSYLGGPKDSCPQDLPQPPWAPLGPAGWKGHEI